MSIHQKPVSQANVCLDPGLTLERLWTQVRPNHSNPSSSHCLPAKHANHSTNRAPTPNLHPSRRLQCTHSEYLFFEMSLKCFFSLFNISVFQEEGGRSWLQGSRGCQQTPPYLMTFLQETVILRRIRVCPCKKDRSRMVIWAKEIDQERSKGIPQRGILLHLYQSAQTVLREIQEH